MKEGLRYKLENTYIFSAGKYVQLSKKRNEQFFTFCAKNL